jgi:hypothetical protein
MVSFILVMLVNICEFRSDCIFAAMDCLVIVYIGELKLSLKNCSTAVFFDLVPSATKSSLFSSINLCKSLSKELSQIKYHFWKETLKGLMSLISSQKIKMLGVQ